MNYKCYSCPNMCEEIFEVCTMDNKENLIQSLHEGIDKLAQMSTPVPPMSVQGLVNSVKSLSTPDKAYLYKMCFGLPGFTKSGLTNKLGLISIIASVLIMQREKAKQKSEITPHISAIDVIIMITGKRYEDIIKDTPLTKDELDSIAFLVEEMAFGASDTNLGGMTTKDEIRSAVLEIFNDSLPF